MLDIEGCFNFTCYLQEKKEEVKAIERRVSFFFFLQIRIVILKFLKPKIENISGC